MVARKRPATARIVDVKTNFSLSGTGRFLAVGGTGCDDAKQSTDFSRRQ